MSFHKPSAPTKRSLASALLLSASVLVSGCSGGTPAGGDTQTLVMSTYTPPSFVPYEAMLEWAEWVEDETDGRIDFEFHHSGSLLADQDTMPGIQDGRASGGIITDLYHPAEFPLTGIIGVPFITGNPGAQGDVLLDLHDSNDVYRAEWEGNGLKLLGIGLLGPAIMGADEPINTLDEITSRRLRGCGFLGVAMADIGIQTVSTTQSEQYEAVQRGVLDGVACVPLDSADDFRYQEVAPHVLDPGTGLYTQVFLVMNLDEFNSLDEDIQATLEGLRDRYTKLTLDRLMEAESEACESFREAGGTFNRFAEADVNRWRDASYDTVLGQWRSAAESRNVDAAAFEEDYLSRISSAEETNTDYSNAVERCRTAK